MMPPSVNAFQSIGKKELFQAIRQRKLLFVVKRPTTGWLLASDCHQAIYHTMLLESLRGKIADLGKAGENANGKVFRGHAKHLVGIWRQFFMCDHQTHKKYCL